MTTEQESRRPKVGVTAMLTHNGRLLLGKRKGSHCAGQIAFPGGHQEWMKTWAETAVDEILEETGLHARVALLDSGFNYLFVTDNRMYADDRHYTTVWVPCVLTGGSQDIDTSLVIWGKEPEKCERWCWFTLDEVIQQLLGKEDYTYSDIHSQDPQQADWLPLNLLLRYSKELNLIYPRRLLP